MPGGASVGGPSQPAIGIPGNPIGESRIPELQDSRSPGFQDSRIPGLQDSQYEYNRNPKESTISVGIHRNTTKILKESIRNTI